MKRQIINCKTLVAAPVAIGLMLSLFLGTGAVVTSILYISTDAAQAQTQGVPSRVDDFAPSTQPGETNGVVGGCNSVKGCKTLKKACIKLKDHEYKPASEGGGSGVCINNNQPTNQESSSSSGVSVNGGTLADVQLTRNSFCHSKALCKELKLACQGTYEKLAGNNGVCRD